MFVYAAQTMQEADSCCSMYLRPAQHMFLHMQIGDKSGSHHTRAIIQLLKLSGRYQLCLALMMRSPDSASARCQVTRQLPRVSISVSDLNSLTFAVFMMTTSSTASPY
jgi:hypothetical protein